ncbi:hypothetical protein KY313_02960 [Candidatus Woesearchaeota archaeon]|jgi:predicted membrane protein|nr:hypothetical protein [Candidatus Woesearchaeota archaeon]
MKRDYFLILGLLFFSLIGLIYLVFSLTTSFYKELFFTEIFILFAIALMFVFYNERAWAGKFTFIFFLLFGFNLLYLKSFLGFNLLLGFLILLSLVAMFLSLFSFGKTQEGDFEESTEEGPSFEKDELFVEGVKPKSLGVFVASKNSSVFHTPDCAFVKRTKQEDKVWFTNKAQATRKKYRAHTCVK